MILSGELSVRDWTQWDLEHASIHEAHRHIREAAGHFHGHGGTVERVDDPQKLRAASQELIELRKGLVAANGGRELPERVATGFQVAQVALSTPRANAGAVVHIARTKEGHIAAVMASHPRPTLRPRSHHLALIGSTGITHGAGSALTRVLMDRAAKENKPVTLVPLDPDAAAHWSGNLAAHKDELSGDMGWTAEEVKRLAAA
jgi:hypothetical protein